MSKSEKLMQRLFTIPKDFTYDEAATLLGQLGFREFTKGKTSGSRVDFVRKSDGLVFSLHKPHPGNVLLRVYVKQLATFIKSIQN